MEVAQILSKEIPAIVLPSVSILLLLTRLNESIWKYFDFSWGPIRKSENTSLKPSETTVLHHEKGENPPFCWKKKYKTTEILTSHEVHHQFSANSVYCVLTAVVSLVKEYTGSFFF